MTQATKHAEDLPPRQFKETKTLEGDNDARVTAQDGGPMYHHTNLSNNGTEEGPCAHESRSQQLDHRHNRVYKRTAKKGQPQRGIKQTFNN